MNKMLKLIMLLLALAMMLSLASCGGSADGGNDEGNGDDTGVTPPPSDNNDEELTDLCLVKDGVANFQIVVTKVMTGSTMKVAQDFTKRLRALGVEVNDPIRDSTAESNPCEIIIGYDLTGRDEKYALDLHDYGPDGYAIKVIDNKVIIIGGDATMTHTALEYFITKVMKISDKTKEFTDFSIEKNYEKIKNTDYIIKSVEIAGNSLKDYVFVADLGDMNKNHVGFIGEMTEEIYLASGIYLETVPAGEVEEGAKKIVVRYVDDAGEDGFRAYVDSDANLIFECAYSNAFSTCVEKIVNDKILDKIGDVSISKSFEKSYHVATVKYSQFGAKGDGITDDFEAIYNTHVFANQSGQKVLGDEGKSYFIHYFNKSIPVRTDVDFCNATFNIDDTGSEIFAVKNIPLFALQRDQTPTILERAQIEKDPNLANATLKQYDTSIPFLVPYLNGKRCYVFLTNNHKDFIRWGGNVSEGQKRLDIVIINPDGTLEDDTPIIWDFEEGDQYLNNGLKKYPIHTPNFERIEIYPVDDKPLTVENGYFARTVCQTVSETGFENVYQAYARGFQIARSNVTMKNITHRLFGEPEIKPSVTVYPGSLYGHDAEGKLKHSYPYGGFFQISKVYNFNAYDCPLTGHTLYWEQKATQSAPVGMGTYDINIYASTNVYFEGITNGVDHCDQMYWGIMCTNGCKNLAFNKCVISRFDAHEGFWNAKITNSEIGFTLNVIGGGELYIENVIRNTGPSFITMRADYGSTFNGTLKIINSTLEGQMAYKGQSHPDKGRYYSELENLYVVGAPFYDTYDMAEYNPSEASSFPYLKWDFGYTCYLPQHVIIDNLQLGKGTEATLYLYNDVGNACFVKPADFEKDIDDPEHLYYNQYQLTKSITYLNMPKAIPICPNKGSYLYTELNRLIELKND